MNNKLLNLYIEGLNKGYMRSENASYAYSCPVSFTNVTTELERECNIHGDKRAFESPEFQLALEICKTKLVEALA